MSKILESPVKKWPGTVVIPDFLTIPQAIAWEDALEDARSLLPDIEFEYKEDGSLDFSKFTLEHYKFMGISQSLKYENKMLPGIKACVESWNLTGFDVNNFPATPRQARVDLFTWLISEIMALYRDETEVPNA